MSIKKTGKTITEQLRDFRAITRDLPLYIGTEAVRFFKDSFKREGFINEGGLQRWKPRKPNARRNKGRKILTDTGALKRSIRITQKTINSVVVGTNLPYAQIHNEGGTIKKTVNVRTHSRKMKKAFGKKLKALTIATIKAHMRKMNITIPQRQFIGKSAFFEKRVLKQIEYKIKKALDCKF